MSVRNFGPQSLRPLFFRGVFGNVLEIGPLDRPVIRFAKYFDILPTEGVREYAANVGRNPAKVPEIDYHSPGGDLSVIPERFDSVVSCHCIEHQPDIIRHLRQVHDLLNPGGAYWLVVPDRRFCFDYFIPDSSAEDMRAARGNTRHTLNTLIRHATRTGHNRAMLHWLGFHGEPRGGDEVAIREKHESGDYVDAHAWQFTPDSFAKCMTALESETGLSVEVVNRTIPAMQEFTAVLRRR